MSLKMRIYVAGPMRGLPELNLPTFRLVAEQLRKDGHVVFSPSDFSSPTDPVDVASGGSSGHSRAYWLRKDVAFIIEHADAIALLPGWERSSGAKLEHYLASELGLARYVVNVDRIQNSTFPYLTEIRGEPVIKFTMVAPGTPPAAPADETILEEAGRLVDGDRAKAYGHPRLNFQRIAAGWAALLGVPVDTRMVARMMAWVKLSRDVHKPHRDNLVDLAGYARTAERLEEDA